MNQEHWSTIASNIVTSFGILSFIGLYISHRHSQNQFKFTVMLSCIDRFQQLSPIKRNDEGDKTRLKRYVDLTNEEFFYFQRGYIPKEVMIEWLDTIVDYFPIYIESLPDPVNYSTMAHKEIHDAELLNGYPRLKKAFRITKATDHRDKISLIKAIGKNLDITFKDRHFKRALVSHT